MIEVLHLRKRFGAVTALEDFSFRACDGVITGLLGANGAGKSTAMRIISGLLRQGAGEVRIDGTIIPAGSPDPRLGSLLDHSGLYPRLTVRENISYFASLYGLNAAESTKRIEGLLDTLGLRPIADRPVAGFSQGQRMKTALARALVHDPRNLILDEPTNGLDVPSIRSLRAMLKRLREDGVCLLYSSHVLEEVRELCDQVVIVARGRVVAQGSPHDICEQTNSPTLEEAYIKITREETESCSARL